MTLQNLAVSLFLFGMLIGTATSDDSVIGKIQMIQAYTPQGLVYFTLKNSPTLDGGGCRSPFFVARMSDQNFKTFVYPVLLSAKVTDADLSLIVSGCLGPYPIVVGAEYSPR